MSTLAEKLASFACWQCGNCCRGEGTVRVTDGEADAIGEYLGCTLEEFTRRYTTLRRDRRGLTLIDQQDADQSCIFLEPNGRCAIEPVKPRQCRDFPYTWRYAGWEQNCENACAWPRKESEKSRVPASG
jgi:Fe-S-cluster containining protein